MKKSSIKFFIISALSLSALSVVLFSGISPAKAATCHPTNIPGVVGYCSSPTTPGTIVYYLDNAGDISSNSPISITASGTPAISGVTNALVTAGANGGLTAFAGSNPCSAGQFVTGISATGTVSCATASSSSATAVTVVAGPGVSVSTATSSSNTTSTVSLNINNGSLQSCSGSQVVNSLSATGTITCAVTITTLAGVSTSSISVTGGTGIGIATTTNSITISNSGVTSFNGQTGAATYTNNAGTGLSVTTSTTSSTYSLNINGGSVQNCTNQGVTGLTATGTIVCSVHIFSLGGVSTGTVSLSGTANQVTVATTTNSITLSLPQNIGTGSSPTFANITVTTNVSAQSFTSTSTVGSNVEFLNNQVFVPANFATIGCNGSSTLTDFGGCVNALYNSVSSTASSVAIMVPDINVTRAQWQTAINFATNMLIPSLVCPGGAQLHYGGTGMAVTFNFNVSGAHDASQDYGCTYLGSSTVISAGGASTATTTGIFFGGATGSNAANGIDFHDNTVNGFGHDIATGANAYGLTIENNSISGGANNATGSLMYIAPANNSGERFIVNHNFFSDPANSSSNNAIYLADNGSTGALADGFWTNNSFDDVTIYLGIDQAIEDFEENHFENAAYSTYLMHYYIVASSSGATTLNVNDNTFQLDNTGATGKLTALIDHAVNLNFSGNEANNTGGGSAITTCIAHDINPGQADETMMNNWSQNSACSNWAQLTGVQYPAWMMEAQNSYPAEIYTTGASNLTFVNGNMITGTDNDNGGWTLGDANQYGPMIMNGGFQLESGYSSITTAAIGGGSLTAGTCASTTNALPAQVVTSSITFVTTPTQKSNVGDDFIWKSFMSATSTIETEVCAIGITGTPSSTTYTVKIIQ